MGCSWKQDSWGNLSLKYILYLFIYFTLQYCISFAIHSHESAMGVHVFPILKPPSHIPPHPIPVGHSSASALSTLYHALNLDWRFVSHTIIYMFQCCSPISSRPCPLPQSPKDCSIHLCLFCCLTYRFIIQFSSVQALSHVWLFATPWIAACQASLSITNSRSLLKLMPIKSVMPSNPSQHQGLFQWINSLHEVAKVLEFQLQHQSFQWTPFLNSIYMH